MKKQLWTILLLSQSILAIGCGHSNISNETTIHSSPETTTVLPQTSTDTSFKNTSGDKAVNLTTGTFLVGQDISTGKYIFTGNGTVSIWNGEIAVINEIIDSSTQSAITSVTTDLYDGQKIEVTSPTSLKLTPVQTTTFQTFLSTGNWIVGIDIEPGQYVCEPVNNEGLLEGKGNLLIYDNKVLLVNKKIDATGNDGVKSFMADLKEGQTISICNIPSLKFTES